MDPQEEARTREKAVSFIVSMACSQRALRADDVAPLARALSALLPESCDHAVQYREALATCALELSRLAREACIGILAEVVDSRIAEIAGRKSEEDQESSELAILQECALTLKKVSSS
eukprot:SRR837773.24985.p1 GENE.SRR837773.24985~~SRR837773.24985.p1  ORF type:complete len:131 (-),score=29.07 SRR837773.24985:12-365(-)